MDKHIERKLTREERIYRKHRRMYLAAITLWVLVIIGLLIWCITPLSRATEPEPEAPVVQIIEEPEAVPMEYDPVRDDIPLDAEIQHLLYKACGETGIRYELALAVIWQETDFRNVIGDGGESAGYMQVQEKWHRDRMERLGVTDLLDPYGNFMVGLDFLAELLEKHELTDALTRYNSGRTGNSQYAQSVLNYMNILTTEDF